MIGWPRVAPAAVVPARGVPFNAPASQNDDKLFTDEDHGDNSKCSDIDSVKAMSRELAAGRTAAEAEAMKLYMGQVKYSQEHAKLSQEQSPLLQQLAAEAQQLVKDAQQLDAIAKKVNANAQKLDKTVQKLERIAKQQGFLATKLIQMAKQQKELECRISFLEEERK